MKSNVMFVFSQWEWDGTAVVLVAIPELCFFFLEKSTAVLRVRTDNFDPALIVFIAGQFFFVIGMMAIFVVT